MEQSRAASLKTRSYASSSSGHSSRSTEAAAAVARAKAEAAKARLSFAEREMKMKLERAHLEAAMGMLMMEKEAAAAIAEADTLEAVINDSEQHSNLNLAAEPLLGLAERTEEYIIEQLHHKGKVGPAPESSVPFQDEVGQNEGMPPPPLFNQALYFKTESNSAAAETRPIPLNRPAAQKSPFTSQPLPSFIRSTPNDRDVHEGLPPAADFIPLSVPKYGPQYTHHNTGVNDFVRCFARRELVTTGLIQFNDQPECYRAWRQSFWSTVKDLDLTASEQMDLLVKWLGKESANHAKRVRAIHVNRPEVGLQMIWHRLDECYGAPEMIEDALFQRIDDFPRITSKDYSRLRELSDLVMELESAKVDGDLPGLSYLDTARGISPILQKLPYSLQERWLSYGSNYKQQHKVSFPPFHVFVAFITYQARIWNDPSFRVSSQPAALRKTDSFYKSNKQKEISVHKMDVAATSLPTASEDIKKIEDSSRQCPIHKKPHLLRKCRAFREMPLLERKAFLKEKGICFKCCVSMTHIAKNCKYTMSCSECDSDKHISALHPGPPPWTLKPEARTEHGGEEHPALPSEVTSRCTQVCGNHISEKSCSKICLVKVYPTAERDRALKVYAILDEQSNRSLAQPEFFDAFDIQGPNSAYSLRTCSGVSEVTGRRACGYQIESLDGKVSLPLPTLLECNDIPNNRSEIPTPDVALHHPHLKSVAHLIPELEPKAAIMLLLGRDLIRAHKVRKQVNGPHNAPYAQMLDLGWVIVGNVCLGNVHTPSTVNVFYTNMKEQERLTIFEPCPNVFHVKERYTNPTVKHTGNSESGQLGSTVFQQTNDDDKVALSISDATFLEIMERGLKRNDDNSWVAPLPFKTPRQRLPDNRTQALNRLLSLRRSLDRKPEMKQHFFTFMEKIFHNGHAEAASSLKEDEERWYLPLFGVYHPKKPGNIRVVFDSSAQFNNVSLNDVLLTGPDLNNTLLGVLMRFRKEAVAIIADIQQMFHCFLVKEEDRNFLRFLWFRDNDPSKDITDYRMKVHIFGNSPSPAVAIYCLRESVKDGDPEVKQFVGRDFYVDDGLKSFPSVEAAVSLLKKTQDTLSEFNLRLHKIASNKEEVTNAFSAQDHAAQFKDLDLGPDTPLVQRSLGLNWDLKSDTFTYQVADEEKPFTRRGVLSAVNSIYDPLGFIAPITIQGKAILRDLMREGSDWDSTLPQEMEGTWNTWRCSLKDLSNLRIPRPYTNISTSRTIPRELCVFSDASIQAIAAVAYLKLTDTSGGDQVGFIMGKAKLTPRPEHTVPRLELCAAVLAVELAELICSEIDTQFNSITFYTDSKVVLGYIYNETRRFYVYVSNRVLRIRKSTRPKQWRYVPTDQNPADIATRFVTAARLPETTWLSGPMFLKHSHKGFPKTENYELVSPSLDKEIRPHVSALKTTITNGQLGSRRFSRFSSWNSLIHAVSCLVHVVRHSHKDTENTTSKCRGWHYCCKGYSLEEFSRSKMIIMRAVQVETYAQELACLEKEKPLPRKSPLKTLDPFVDADGLLRVGGRITEAHLLQDEKKPIIIPGKHHIARLLIRHYHERTQHQGRLFTEGAVRAAGLWILGGKRCVSNVIYQCVTCRRLRGAPQTQKMSDLPADRLSTDPAFTNVGMDVFGPWAVFSRRTRGGLAHSKRWAVIFTCLSVRAVHIEVIEALDTSSFINALRRFLAIRGPVKVIRSDCGTNFVGACKMLKIPSSFNNTAVEKFLLEKGCIWKFNPPHASHMGGSWERMIGIVKRILDSMFLQFGSHKLTHETLTTFMAEVMAIINSRPLIPVSTDPSDPFILTPTTLLTQKVNLPSVPVGEFGVKDLHRQQWRQVQHLAQTFWDRWRKQYLSSLQPRRKWQSHHPDIKPGSVVVLKDSCLKRHEWPLGIITQVFPSRDGRIRKVEVKTSRKEGTKFFVRPVTEVILLINPERAL